MSTGNLGLDAILNTVKEDYLGDTDDSLAMIKKRYPKLSEKEAEEIFLLLKSNCEDSRKEKSSLVVTAPPSFRIKSVSTKTAVRDILEHAKKSILITGYSLSDYFADSNDVIIRKSQSGVFTRFFINKIDEQTNVEKLLRYKGKFLRIYNYPEVKAVYLISGGYDLLVILEEKSLKEIANFVTDKLSTLDSVLSTATHFILKKYKDHGTILNREEKDEREVITP